MKQRPAPPRTSPLRLLVRFGRPYRGSLISGAVFSLGVVFTRLALPWPLRGLMETVFHAKPSAPGSLVETAASVGEPILVFCGAYLLLALSSGLFELLQRVQMARFASRTAHDLRAAAVDSVGRSPQDDETSSADLVTRIIGDSARLKADLKGILIHVTQNGLLLCGITVMFLYIAPKLGLLFFAGGAVAVLVGVLNVGEVEQTALRQRRKESRYAARIHEEDWPPGEEEAEELNLSSARKDVRTTRLIGQATLWAHGAVALVISLALWIGARDVRSGALAPGELFLFVAYALMVHRRAVRVGRQVARGGKLLACAGRIGALLRPVAEPASRMPSSPPRITLEAVRVAASPLLARRSRLHRLDLELEPGCKVLVLGANGAGVSTLLELLAGRLAPSRGEVLVDRVAVTGGPELRAASCFVGQTPQLPRHATPRDLCRLAPGEVPDATLEAQLRALGAARVIASLAGGWDQPLAPLSLSPGERCSLLLASVLRDPRRVWILDRPFVRGGARDRERLAVLLDAAEDRTLVISLPRGWLVDRFDRVLVLRRGRVVFDDTPQRWRERKPGAPLGGPDGAEEEAWPPTER